MQRNLRVITLEIIYQLLMMLGFLSAFGWLITGLELDSPWLIGMCCIPVSLLLTFVNYFIRDRIAAIKLRKYRTSYPDSYFKNNRAY